MKKTFNFLLPLLLVVSLCLSLPLRASATTIALKKIISYDLPYIESGPWGEFLAYMPDVVSYFNSNYATAIVCLENGESEEADIIWRIEDGMGDGHFYMRGNFDPLKYYPVEEIEIACRGCNAIYELAPIELTVALGTPFKDLPLPTYDPNNFYVEYLGWSSDGYNGLDNCILTSEIYVSDVSSHPVANPNHLLGRAIITVEPIFINSWNIGLTEASSLTASLYQTSLDPVEYKLDIQGTGPTANYSATTQPWASYKNQITEINIGDGIVYLGTSLFSGCSAVKSVTIGEGVGEIATQAFSGCSALTALVLPSSLGTIRSYAFLNCSSLGSLVLPSGVGRVEKQAFGNCYKLTTISFERESSSPLTIIGEAFYTPYSTETLVLGNHPSIGTYNWAGDNRALLNAQ